MAEKTLELSSQGVYKGFFPYLKKNYLRKKKTKNKNMKTSLFLQPATVGCKCCLTAQNLTGLRTGRRQGGAVTTTPRTWNPTMPTKFSHFLPRPYTWPSDQPWFLIKATFIPLLPFGVLIHNRAQEHGENMSWLGNF